MGGGDKKSAAAKSGLSKNDKPDPPHNTQKIIAESLGMSTGKVEIIRAKSINQVYQKMIKLIRRTTRVQLSPATIKHNARAAR